MSARANSMSRGPCESRGSFSDEYGGRQKDRGKDGKEETTRLLLYPAAVSTRETGAMSPLIFFLSEFNTTRWKTRLASFICLLLQTLN